MRIKSVRDNRGFSLVELIVVIAIMAVMLGGGVYTVTMLSGAEAKQGAQKTESQLNDIKTGAMSRAGEYMIIRYISVPKGSEDDYAKVGIDKSGFYAEKHISTIANTESYDAEGKPILSLDYADVEFTRIASAKVSIGINDDPESAAQVVTSDNGAAIRIEFNRSNGSLRAVEYGTTGNTKDSVFTSSDDVDLDKLYFRAGIKTYFIAFDPTTGKHVYNKEIVK